MSILFRSDLADFINAVEEAFSYPNYEKKQEKPKKPITELQLEMPGVPQDSIKIKHVGEYLKVAWVDRKQNERQRQIWIGLVDTVDATYKDGLLTIKTVRKKKDEGTEVKIKGG